MPAPEKFQARGKKTGLAPLMPQTNCVNKNAGNRFVKENLFLVWSEEGDAVALYENDNILAIIPSWSGYQGFAGFSIECSKPNPLADPLDHDSIQIPRFNAARGYWAAWEKSDFWENYQEEMLSRITKAFGDYSYYYAIDDGKWHPWAMALIEKKDYNQLVTLGLSLRPQPSVEMTFEDFEEYNRFEFAWAFSKDFSIDEIEKFGRYMGGQANTPWKFNTWFGNGHTIEINSADGFGSVLLMNEMPLIEVKDLGRYRGSKINLLYLVPLTEDEQVFTVKNSSAELLPHLVKKGVTHIFQKTKR